MSFNGYPKTLSNLYKTYIEYSEEKKWGAEDDPSISILLMVIYSYIQWHFSPLLKILVAVFPSFWYL